MKPLCMTTILLIIACCTRPLAAQRANDDPVVAALQTLNRTDIPVLTQQANAGEIHAQVVLGVAYLQGIVVEKNVSVGAGWVRKAAEQGHAGAQNELARCYALGEGVGKDDSAAVKWYRLAAEQGLSAAQLNLAAAYANGTGVTQDFAEAMKWYLKAADQGNRQAQFDLATMYTHGQSVPVDYVQAYTWVSIAHWSPGRKADPELKWLATKMSAEQIAEAEARAADWVKAHQYVMFQPLMRTPPERTPTPAQLTAWKSFTAKLHPEEMIWLKPSKGGSYFAAVVEIREDSLVVDEYSKSKGRDPAARRELQYEQIKEVWDIDLLSDTAFNFTPTKGRKLYERK